MLRWGRRLAELALTILEPRLVAMDSFPSGCGLRQGHAGMAPGLLSNLVTSPCPLRGDSAYQLWRAITLAIDTPLGWIEAFHAVLAGAAPDALPASVA